MNQQKKRLERLEQTSSNLPFKPVFWQQDKGYWVTDSPDYRECVGGQGARFITEDEFHELERSYQVLLIRFVDVNMGVVNNEETQNV